jgi:cobalt-precorrin 5A hydrolase/precorrin-3B C17-methyltransferase
VIERRLKAAAEGDFVVALYNPKSRRRRTQLDRAMSILGKSRPAATPVIVAANLGRPEERIATTTLGDFDAGQVDMLTVVIVGSSATRRMRKSTPARVYTPRGYAAKGRAP